jgi:DNA polymerase
MVEEALRELEEAVRRPGALSPVDILELAHRCVRSCHECSRGASGAGAAVGTGPASARLMVVGAEPEKDDAGASRSFSAEAEHLLQRALGKAGIGLQDVYFTTAIKHRDSDNTAPATPVEEEVSERDLGAISACRRLLEAEMAAVKPEVVLCLGSTATLSVLGRRMDLPAERGRTFHPGFVPVVVVTVNVATVLAQPAGRLRDKEFDRLVVELHDVAELLGVSDPFKGRDELAQL